MRTHITVPDINSNIFIHGFIFGVEEPGWTLEDSHHDIFELTFCIEGLAEQRIGRETFVYGAGDWMFLKPGVKHGTTSSPDHHFSYMAIHFDIDDPGLRRLLKRSALIHVPAKLAGNMKLKDLTLTINNLLQSNISRNRFIERDMRLALQLDESDKLTFQACILQIISEYIRQVRVSETALSGEYQDISKQDLTMADNVRGILESHVLESLSMSEVYEAVGLSRSQCTRIFTKVFGVSPRQYYSNLKLKKAKELLLLTNLAVEEISRMLSFSSVYHFSRQFKRWTSLSPSQYRLKPPSATNG
ncbi:AraC family transcriptional regulator [Cohnella silvisoli]|uniref:AraC family transcriptional regulator n=1 Tax=Cohnella silvisoli TaxID=2873699 RepID=A0ABV1KQE4_9BACL|nr:AraC family transcriptional regulator [Cohnella silvisoli]MCD9022016.1 AraC family transcriptional regulator [Cohnella silvisoli]